MKAARCVAAVTLQVDSGRMFPTFKTEAVTRTDTSSRFGFSPAFSFSFSLLQDFILADFLKIPSVYGPFSLMQESISWGSREQHMAFVSRGSSPTGMAPCVRVQG